MIQTVIRWRNGMVMVFDDHGEQIPAYQGWHDDVRHKILTDAPPTAEFMHADWDTGAHRPVPRSEW